MTDVDPFAKLRTYPARIAAAKKAVTDLEDERNEEVVRTLGNEPAYGAITGAARAAKLSRQHVDRILRLARARRAGPHDPQ